MPNIAVTNAYSCFVGVRLVKAQDLQYIMNATIARQVLSVIKREVELCEPVHRGEYYAEDYCATIDELFLQAYNEKI